MNVKARLFAVLETLPSHLGRLPARFQWTAHNFIAHPLSEILYQLGYEQESNAVHDLTMPLNPENQRG